MRIEDAKKRLIEVHNRASELQAKATENDGTLGDDEAKELDDLLKEGEELMISIQTGERENSMQRLGEFMEQPSRPPIQVPMSAGYEGSTGQPTQTGTMADDFFAEPELENMPRILSAQNRQFLARLQVANQQNLPGAPGFNPGMLNMNAGPRISSRFNPSGMSVFVNGERDAQLAYGIGRFIAAAVYRHPQSIRWCNEHGIRYQNQHVESINTAGGIWVPEEWADRIIDTRNMYGTFRANTFVQPMSGDSLNTRRRVKGYTAYHTGERQSTNKSDPNLWANVGLVAKKISAETSVSDELQADALAAMADSMTMAAGEAIGLREDLDGYLGDGTSEYGGIHGVFTKILEGNKLSAVPAKAGHNTMLTIDADDLTALMGVLPEAALRLGGIGWHMSQYAYATVVGRISMGAGGNTITDYAAGWTPQFLGYPVALSPVLPAQGTYTNQAMIGFGSLRNASIMGDRTGIMMKTDMLFDTDEIGIKWQERYDIDVFGLGDDTEAGMFACLIGTA